MFKKAGLILGLFGIVMACFASMPSISTAFQAQPGELYSVTLTSTVEGIQSALRGDIGTGIFQRGDGLIFMWRMWNGFAFVGINTDTKHMVRDLLDVKANFGNIQDYSGIVSTMMKAGWTSISYKVVEGSIRNPILIATLNKIAENMCDKFTTFVILPLTTDPNGQIGVIHYEKIDSDLQNQ